MTKNCILAIIVAFAASIAFDYAFHGLFMMDFYSATSSVWRPEAEMKQLCQYYWAGQFLLVFVSAVIFKVGYKGEGHIEGIRFGFLLGLILASQPIMEHVWLPVPEAITFYHALGAIFKGLVIGVALVLVYTCQGCTGTAEEPKKAKKPARKKK